MSGLGRIITSAAIGGLVVGGALGFFTASDPDPATLALDAVPVYLCPGEGEVGTLHRGDRILVTGRSGDWLAVRNVRGSGERVFIRSAAIVPDSALDGLPEVDCDDAGTLAVATTVTTVVDETTTTTEAGGESTTTSSSSTTSTTSPTSTTSTTAGTTTTSSTTTTTTQPPPSVGSVSANPNPIWEEYTAGNYSCSNPSESTISASVSAPAGVQSVTLLWTTNAHGSGSKAMSGSGTYTAVLGPFAAEATPNGGSDTVTVTVRVTDGLGRQASSQRTVTLNDCTLG